MSPQELASKNMRLTQRISSLEVRFGGFGVAGLMLARVSSDGHGDDEAIAIVLCFIVIGRT